MRTMTTMHNWQTITQVLLQQPGDVNSTAPRPDIAGDWPEGDLPEQMGGARTTLMPNNYTFRLPDNLPQLWHTVEIEDTRPFLANGQPNPTKGQKVPRRQLKLDRNSPMVVVGGPHDGEPMTATITNNPRPRGKKDDPKTPWISDLAYLLEISLRDKTRPTTAEALVATINKYAGKTVRIETGLSAQCRPDKVRYIVVATGNPAFNPAVPETPVGGANSKTIESTMVDPSGTKGCGTRYYTKDFKNPEAKPGEDQYDREIACDCNAVLRGFEQIERFLPPLGA